MADKSDDGPGQLGEVPPPTTSSSALHSHLTGVIVNCHGTVGRRNPPTEARFMLMGGPMRL